MEQKGRSWHGAAVPAAAPEEGDGFAELVLPTAPVRRAVPIAPQRIAPQPVDETRRLFLQMRRLRTDRSFHAFSPLYAPAALFYRQGKYMEAFEDDYEQDEPLTLYYPSYQMASYAQLRTYFTWRSRLRQGELRPTSFSYVCMYIYELINHIGTTGARDGWDKLSQLWQTYRAYEPKLDRYMREWLLDYYIVNDISEPFPSLIADNPFLEPFYTPVLQETAPTLYASLSDYRLESSGFYSADRAPWLQACTAAVWDALSAWLQARGGTLDALFFYRWSGVWRPFHNALYFPGCQPALPQRTVSFPDGSCYRYAGGHWCADGKRIPRKTGPQLAGYILKRVEQFYRLATRYRYRLHAVKSRVDQAELARLLPDGDCDGFFACIDAAIRAYYRQSQQVRVSVDPQHLDRIRALALDTQEKLLVHPEADVETPPAPPAPPSRPCANPALHRTRCRRSVGGAGRRADSRGKGGHPTGPARRHTGRAGRAGPAKRRHAGDADRRHQRKSARGGCRQYPGAVRLADPV